MDLEGGERSAGGPSAAQFEAGLALRKAMFGEAGATAALAPGYKQPLEEMVTRICFGEVWQRPLLTPKIRSLLTLALLAVQSKPVQLKAHLRGAIANGASPDEIREVLIHVMIYGGLPAAADSLNHAAELFAEMGLV